MISTDRKIFEQGSTVRARQAEYAKDWDEVHIIIFNKKKSGGIRGQEDGGGGQNGESVIAPNCWAYSTQSWIKLMYPFDAMRLGRFIIEKRGITEMTCQDASLTAMAGISFRKQFNIPLEIQVHEDIGSPNFGYTISNKIRKTLALSYLPKADKIRVVSNKIKDYLVGTLNIDVAKITVKPIFVDVEKIKNAPIIEGADLHKKYPQFEKIVLIASRLEKEKNIGMAIRAWAEVIKKLNEKNRKVGLVIVGDGSQFNTLKNLAGISDLTGQTQANAGARFESKKSGQSVIFENWADKDTLISYYKTCDQFLVTSLFEGYGMTLVEAHAAGCKIISTDVGVAREVGAKIVGWNEGELVEVIVKELNK